MVNAKTFLEKRYNDELELEDAVHTALLTLKEGFEGAMDHTNIEVRARLSSSHCPPLDRAPPRRPAAIRTPCLVRCLVRARRAPM